MCLKNAGFPSVGVCQVKKQVPNLATFLNSEYTKKFLFWKGERERNETNNSKLFICSICSAVVCYRKPNRMKTNVAILKLSIKQEKSR